ncbi:hypothetical protein K470DRAFT_266491 [Piedraia hortae CBS 480.64]|uniref:Uncharacterized protein n=1 Tax=Piedraia hortae CBS 480.64 TaxID=1314780 RepID=A0A6A7BRN9_9PEZI|nr:hypothetical protein K470DRAFT_266491 [Piedraia hortae CBS 480.64]
MTTLHGNTNNPPPRPGTTKPADGKPLGEEPPGGKPSGEKPAGRRDGESSLKIPYRHVPHDTTVSASATKFDEESANSPPSHVKNDMITWPGSLSGNVNSPPMSVGSFPERPEDDSHEGKEKAAQGDVKSGGPKGLYTTPRQGESVSKKLDRGISSANPSVPETM